jgi:uncharacterized SAM-binding protein YcdF (DUF218 family)
MAKLLLLLVYPLGMAILLTIGGIVLNFVNCRSLSTLLTVVAVIQLWVFSTPYVSNHLLAALEQQISREESQSAEVAIVLGGMLREGRNGVDLTDAADRALQAARLYRAHMVKHILVSGGNQPTDFASVPEARRISELLVEWGVPPQAIFVEDNSRSTWENAKNSKVIWDQQRFASGFLITSAAHMPRALAVFRKAGFHVVAKPTDFHSVATPRFNAIDMLPDVSALESSTLVIKETIGHTVYWLRGWI